VMSFLHNCQESSEMIQANERQKRDFFEQRRQSEMKRGEGNSTAIPKHPLPKSIRLSMEVLWPDHMPMRLLSEPWATSDTLHDIMAETQCTVEFDKPGRGSAQFNPHAKQERFITNTLHIIGESVDKVQEAQRRIRGLSSISLTLSIRHIKPEYMKMSLRYVISTWRANGMLSSFSKIRIEVVDPSRQNAYPFIIFRGAVRDCVDLQKVAEMVAKLLCAESSEKPPTFGGRIEVPVSQRRWFAGDPEGILFRAISQSSQCIIHYPMTDRLPCAYFFSGSAEAVIKAVQMFYMVMPVQLSFEAEETDLTIRGRDGMHHARSRYDKDLAVSYVLARSPYEGKPLVNGEEKRHTVTLRTIEENVANLFALRKKFLNVSKQQQRGKSSESQAVEQSEQPGQLKECLFVKYIRIQG